MISCSNMIWWRLSDTCHSHFFVHVRCFNMNASAGFCLLQRWSTFSDDLWELYLKNKYNNMIWYNNDTCDDTIWCHGWTLFTSRRVVAFFPVSSPSISSGRNRFDWDPVDSSKLRLRSGSMRCVGGCGWRWMFVDNLWSPHNHARGDVIHTSRRDQRERGMVSYSVE